LNYKSSKNVSALGFSDVILNDEILLKILSKDLTSCMSIDFSLKNIENLSEKSIIALF
jgi:hypothetical protein